MMWCFVLSLALIAALQVPGLANDSQEIVSRHNALRTGVQPTASNMKMSWSSEAEANAKKWADKCTLKYSPNNERKISSGDCGENVYVSSYKTSWTNAIRSWYNKYKNWQYGVGSVNGEVMGPFTKVVWYRFNLIGCAMAHCPNAEYQYFYVCHYCPLGNYRDSEPYTSGEACAACPENCDNGLCPNSCPYTREHSNCPILAAGDGCKDPDVAEFCPMSCKCTNQII